MGKKLRGALLAFLLLINASSLRGAVFTVHDTTDSSSVSLRQAILSANALGGHNEIRFEIPGTGPFTITPLSPLPAITNPITIDGTTQPGYAGTPVIHLSGASLDLEPGLDLRGGSSIVRGLWTHSFKSAHVVFFLADGNTIESCYLTGNLDGTSTPPSLGAMLVMNQSSGNVIGGPDAGNLISGGLRGISFDHSSDNRVEGNLIGTNAAGTAKFLANPDLGSVAIEVSSNSSRNSIGGTSESMRNIITGFGQGVFIGQGSTSTTIQGNYFGLNKTGSAMLTLPGTGIRISGDSETTPTTTLIANNVISGCFAGIWSYQSNGVVIQGNRIGTNPAGTAAFPNSWGILAHGHPGFFSKNMIIGGAGPGEGNLISGNNNSAIAMLGTKTFGILIQGNRIGTDISGQFALGNKELGINIANEVHDVLIGGDNPGEANIIAHNNLPGIGLRLQTSSTGSFPYGIRITRNLIFANKGWNIDLIRNSSDQGHSANDHLDGDTGPNGSQNYPVLSNFTFVGPTMRVYGSLDSIPNKTYRIEFFLSPNLGQGGQAEAQTYLGTTDVTTDALGLASFSFAYSSAFAGQYITATATDPDGNTSELSPGTRSNVSVTGVEPVFWTEYGGNPSDSH